MVPVLLTAPVTVSVLPFNSKMPTFVSVPPMLRALFSVKNPEPERLMFLNAEPPLSTVLGLEELNVTVPLPAGDRPAELSPVSPDVKVLALGLRGPPEVRQVPVVVTSLVTNC